MIVAALFIVGISALSMALAALSVGVLASIERLRRRVQFSERFRQGNLTTEAVERIPLRPGFEITDPGEALPPGVSQTGESESLEAANFRTALLDLHARFETPLPQAAKKPPLDFTAMSLKLVEALNALSQEWVCGVMGCLVPVIRQIAENLRFCPSIINELHIYDLIMVLRSVIEKGR